MMPAQGDKVQTYNNAGGLFYGIVEKVSASGLVYMKIDMPNHKHHGETIAKNHYEFVQQQKGNA